MTRIATLLPAVVAAIALAASPALAKSKKHHRHHNATYTEPYGHAPNAWGGPGWNTRNVSDPSLGHPSAADLSRRSGRCVADLGYGRYEYCGW